MKGLLIKDFYVIKSILIMMLIVFIVIGFGLSFITSPWTLTILTTILLGMIVTNTIQMDKTSGWLKVSIIFPVQRKAIIDSKYLMYLILSSLGLIFGLALTLLITFITHDFDSTKITLFINISIVMSLLSGSILIPCSYLLNEEKSIIAMVIAYPIASAICVGLILLSQRMNYMPVINICISLILFIISWLICKKYIIHQDI